MISGVVSHGLERVILVFLGWTTRAAKRAIVIFGYENFSLGLMKKHRYHL